jgi:hypothetical protein
MEGPLSVMETRAKEFHCFLFNDLFVRTKQKKKRSNSCVWKGEVPLGNVTLIDLDDTAARRNAFQVSSRAHCVHACVMITNAQDSAWRRHVHSPLCCVWT